MQDKSVELLPCPFCGGTRFNISHPNAIYCLNMACGGAIESEFGRYDHPVELQKQVTHKAWNTRAQPPAAAPNSCSHYWRRIGDVQICEDCGVREDEIEAPAAAPSDADRIKQLEEIVRMGIYFQDGGQAARQYFAEKAALAQPAGEGS